MDFIPSSYSGFTLEGYLTKVSNRSRAIYWIIILFVFSGLAILPMVYVDVTVQARGYFQSDTEKQYIYAPFQGKVVLANVNNGTSVKAGDTLLVIESESLKAQRRSLGKNITANSLAINDLDKLVRILPEDIRLTKTCFNTERYCSEYSRLINSISIQKNRYQKAEADLERNKTLHDGQFISDSEFENVQFTYNTEKENLEQIFNSEISRWNTDLSERRTLSATLDAEFEDCLEQMKNRIVLSPVNGEIISSSEIQPGAIVSVNQLITQISPEGNLVATCFVKPGDVGLVNEGQSVLLQVDAFNYNQWGLLRAEIADISDDIITDNSSSAYFRVTCNPDRTFLSLKNGMSVSVKKGMSLNARIIINRRSLFNLLFDKVDKWINPYSNKKV